MIDNIYKIGNLQCKYEKEPFPSLEIENLSIQKGHVVFIVGPSGSGKSTLLETFGLMNKTFLPNENLIFNFRINENNIISLTELWNRKELFLARFRQKHFSFIFQSTNLFPNLTAYENIILPAILQGIPKNIAINKARNILKEIAPNLNGNKRVVDIAGGERQRVAFARAIVGDFSVLLADEPTGNLDISNADLLMERLMRHLKGNNNTAIIVTHDIKLAIKYADQIVFISINERENSSWRYGIVNKESFYTRIINTEKWEKNKPAPLDKSELEKELRSKMNQIRTY